MALSPHPETRRRIINRIIASAAQVLGVVTAGRSCHDTRAIGIGLALLAVLVLQNLATSLTVESGGSGGVFAPGIVIGGYWRGPLGLMRNIRTCRL